MILMTALDPEANAILEAGRRALQATTSDCDRIEAALRARLGLQALPLDVIAKPLVPSTLWRFGPGATIGICLVGCALFFALRMRPSAVATNNESSRPAPLSAAITAPVVATESASEQPGAVTIAPVVSAAAPPVAVPPSVSSQRQEDGLAQEVALLLRATSALGAGRAGEALKALNEHQRRFPNGALSQERSSAKAQAFCSLGRLSEGRAELAHLTPQSPAANRARQVCGSTSTLSEQR